MRIRPHERGFGARITGLDLCRLTDSDVAEIRAAWHSDWSFQKTPPAATILHAKTVPPVGGDTLYADGYAAFDALSQTEQSELQALWINSVYVIGIKGMSDAESLPLLERLNAFSTEAPFVYRHHGSENMLTMRDNRSMQHTAEGGYDGPRRVMHRTTVVGDSPYLAAD
jgi:taurine dioxygenase